LVKRQP